MHEAMRETARVADAGMGQRGRGDEAECADQTEKARPPWGNAKHSRLPLYFMTLLR